MDDLLKFAIDNGMLDLSYVQERIEMSKRKELLEKHTNPIWRGKGKDDRWKTRLPDDNNTLIAKKNRIDLENVVIDFYKKKEEKPLTFNDAYNHWRGVQDKLVSDNTVAKYITDYNRYFKDSDFALIEIAKITEEDMKVFICTTVKRLSLCQKACKTLFLYLKNVINSARINHFISLDPMEFLEAKQFYKFCTNKKRNLDSCLVSDSDMEMLYKRFYEDYEKNPHYIPTYAVEFATLTGMRVGELSALRWDSMTEDYIIIDKSEKYNRITKEYFIDKTKNERDRVFPLTQEIKSLLDRIKKAEMKSGTICEWVFADENGRIHAPVISSCSKSKCRQIGITEKGIHAYRRTVNSKMRCSGVSATVAAALLGHTEEVNEQYYTFDVSNLTEKMKIVSAINLNTVYKEQKCN